MRDIPMFTTENGIATLVLREIPTKQTAYIHLQSSQEPERLLSECVDFCRAAGAEKIYATGHACLEKYPLFTTIICMRGRGDNAGELHDKTVGETVADRQDLQGFFLRFRAAEHDPAHQQGDTGNNEFFHNDSFAF